MNQNQAYGNPVAKSAEQPVLLDCNKRIHARIGSAHEAATRIENVLDRLINPTPRAAETDGIKPNPATIEAMLNDTDAYASGLAERLHSLASRLERAA